MKGDRDPSGRRVSGLIAVAGVAAIAMAVPTLDATAAGDAGPEASKSSSKKNRQRAKKYIQGVWTAGASSDPVFTTVAFCTNGTYGFRVLKSNSGRPSDTTFDGGWAVRSAGKTSARVRYTIEHFQSAYIDGSPGPDSSPGSPAVLAVSATSRNTANFDGVPFTRGAGSCSNVADLLSAGG
jgi:hypothetical protein